jgi:uncharacterized protein (DUF1501 family)
MKQFSNHHFTTRRDFLRRSASAGLGVGFMNALFQTRLMAQAAALSVGSDYKALVCLFLNGGNDSNNMIIPLPLAGSDLRDDYVAGRGIVTIGSNLTTDSNGNPNDKGHPIKFATAKAFARHYPTTTAPLDIPGSPLGFHMQAKELADLFNANELAIVSNVGSLAYPFASRAEYLLDTIPRPRYLGSHSDQQTQWQTSIADRSSSSGWGGRLAEMVNAANENSQVSMAISLAGVNPFQVSPTGLVQQYVLKPEGVSPLTGFAQGNNPYGAAFLDPNYLTTPEGHRLKAFEQIMNHQHANLHEQEYNTIIRRARLAEGSVGDALIASDTQGVNFNQVFAAADSSIGDQLKSIARLIAARDELGNKRQIFFCQVGGFDQHSRLLGPHAASMKELSKAMKAFRDALVGLGVFDKVTTFTASDFNRTFIPNGGGGTDHAWGGHALVMGGAVNGGDIYGHFPKLKLGDAAGSIDASPSNRGLWIPDVSVDQYAARLARWLGANPNSMEVLFPNLSRFDDPCAANSPANLDFLPLA